MLDQQNLGEVPVPGFHGTWLQWVGGRGFTAFAGARMEVAIWPKQLLLLLNHFQQLSSPVYSFYNFQQILTELLDFVS